MNIKNTLRTIHEYYANSRGAGHSTALNQGVQKTDRVYVLCNNYRQGRSLGLGSAQIASLDNLELLRGSFAPLLIDNGAMQVLAGEAVKEIERLEAENEKLKAELAQQKNSGVIIGVDMANGKDFTAVTITIPQK